jgi:hypothetical protein
MLIVLLALACATQTAPTEPVATAPAVTAPADDVVVYTCSMHPEITSDEPGDCSVCGMSLVEQKAPHGHDDEEAGGHDH